MKKKNVLSLHEETEKEAAKIEKEILKDSKLEEIKVSDEMEKRLAEQIQAYEKTQSQKKVHRHSPLFRRRVMVAAAVLMIAAVATSVTAVGSKSYLKEIIEKFTGETGQASVINVEDMDTQASESADETQVYREIKEKLGIHVVRMEYKPKGMRLQRYIIDEAQKRTQVFYQYQGNVVWYSIYMNGEDSSLGQKESDEIAINQRIIAGNAQFTGIAAGRGVGFTTGLLLLRKGLGMRETPIRPHSWHCRMQSGYQYGGNRKRPPVWRRHRGSLRPRGRNLGGVEGMTGNCGSGCDPVIHTRRLRVYHRPRRLRMASRISIFFAARRFEPLNSMG